MRVLRAAALLEPPKCTLIDAHHVLPSNFVVQYVTEHSSDGEFTIPALWAASPLALGA